MNNQMPYNFLPPMMNGGCNCQKIDNKLEKLENKIKQLEKRVTFLENNMNYPTPYTSSFMNQEPIPNNYII